jgi:hypothetical protein
LHQTRKEIIKRKKNKQKIMIPPFDNLQRGKGNGPRQGVDGVLNLHLTMWLKNPPR